MTITKDFFHVEKEIPWEDLGNGIKRQIYGYDDTLMLVKVKFETGAVGSLHTHNQVQSTFVVSGSFEFTIGDERKIVNAGDGCFMPSEIPHGCVCLQSGILIDSFSPYRSDFLTK